MVSAPNYRSIGCAADRLARQVEVALATFDLSSAQYRVLVQLGSGAEASTALAKKLAVSAPTITAVVDGLVQRGAVERTHSAEDRRRVSLELTSTGRDLLDAAADGARVKLESIADELDDEDLATSAIASLAVWGEALDRARTRRLAAPNRPAMAPR
jgi:DNA-binding MarR family transcriptional regulator